MFPTLMWCAAEHGRRLEEELPGLVGLAPALVVLVEEPVRQELELEMAQAVVVERPLQVAQALRLEQMLDVRVPEAEPAEADRARFGATVGPAEEAPLATVVHLDRPGDRPVQTEQLDVHRRAHRLIAGGR